MHSIAKSAAELVRCYVILDTETQPHLVSIPAIDRRCTGEQMDQTHQRAWRRYPHDPENLTQHAEKTDTYYLRLLQDTW